MERYIKRQKSRRIKKYFLVTFIIIPKLYEHRY